MKHTPRKRFGQNFLQNSFIIEQIMQLLHLEKDDQVIEIGPGQGALTAPMLMTLRHLTAIEIDRDLCRYLTNRFDTSLTLIEADALTLDYAAFGRGIRLVGNLPYNISTPLLIHLLGFLGDLGLASTNKSGELAVGSQPLIKDMHFMLQKEVAERLAAKPCTKAFGRLTVIAQYFCDVQLVLDVPPDAFYPIPAVESAIVRLRPYVRSPFELVSFSSLQKILAQAFGMRRKTLANNLKPFFTVDDIKNMGINPSLRPESLDVNDYVTLTKYLANDMDG